MSSNKNNPIDKEKLDTDQLLNFISGYGSPISPQSVDEIQGDFQLAGLSTVLNSYLSHKPSPKILDIGCGNGVLLAKLVGIKAFENNPKLEYIGFDLIDRLNYAFESLTKNRILSQARLLQIDNHWIEYMTDPSIVVIRNVFHELKINEAAKLIIEICEHLPTNSVVLLQDMTTLPKAEKRNAGWLGLHLKKIFEAGGIKSNYTPDKSKSGVDVFLLEGQRHAKCEITEKDILKLLIAARKEQLKVLKVKYDATESVSANTLLLSRLSHDIAVISLELHEFGAETVNESEKYNEQTVASTFSLAFNSLSESDIDELRKKFRYPEIKGFQNRSHSIQAIDDFIRSDKTIFLLSGGHFIGKKTIVWQALEKNNIIDYRFM